MDLGTFQSSAAYWTVPISNCLGFYDTQAEICQLNKFECDLFGAENSIYVFSNQGWSSGQESNFGIDKHCKRPVNLFRD